MIPDLLAAGLSIAGVDSILTAEPPHGRRENKFSDLDEQASYRGGQRERMEGWVRGPRTFQFPVSTDGLVATLSGL